MPKRRETKVFSKSAVKNVLLCTNFFRQWNYHCELWSCPLLKCMQDIRIFLTLVNNFQPLANDTESSIFWFCGGRRYVSRIDKFHLILCHNTFCWLSLSTLSQYSYSMSLLITSYLSFKSYWISVWIGSSNQCVSPLNCHPQPIILDNSTSAVSNLFQIQLTVVALILKDILARGKGWEGIVSFWI